MKPQIVDADSLATLLLLDKELEPIPEPIRLQPALTLIIDYDEYIKFCNTYLETKDYLYYRTADIKQWLSTGNENMLLKSFYADVARAVLKELHFAHFKRKRATRITHFLQDAQLLTPKDIQLIYRDIQPFVTNYIIPYMDVRGFPIPQYHKFDENTALWEYAAILLFYTQVPKCPRIIGDF